MPPVHDPVNTLSASPSYLPLFMRFESTFHTMQVELNFDQILSLVKQLPQDEKLRLSQALAQDGIESRLSSILGVFKTDDLSDDDITAEVEAVRQARYEKKARY